MALTRKQHALSDADQDELQCTPLEFHLHASVNEFGG